MSPTYVEQSDGRYVVTGTRVSLHSIVYGFLAGQFRRYPEIDLRTATVAGLAGLKDAEVLALAGRDGRVLITHHHSTMPRHFGEFAQAQSNRVPGGRKKDFPDAERLVKRLVAQELERGIRARPDGTPQSRR